MKKFITILFALATLSSCTLRYTPVSNTEFQKIDFSQIRMFEKGSSCKRWVLGIIPLPFGQPSIMNAVKDAKIRKVEIVEYENGFSLLPLPMYKRCLVVYGLR